MFYWEHATSKNQEPCVLNLHHKNSIFYEAYIAGSNGREASV